MKRILNRKAEGYIDTVVCVLAAMMVIVLALNVFSFLTLKQDLDYFAKEMIDVATTYGRTVTETSTRYAELCDEIGIYPSYSFSGTDYFNTSSGKVQLGDIYADDNATSGDGEEKDYLDGYGWYNYYQYLWKVTVFVGKSDEATTNSDLTSDFHRVGTVIMKKTGWSVSSSVMFGDQTKVDYYDGASLGLASSVNIISDSNCPQIPIVCFGNISTVKSYFGSTGTMSTVLNAIAADEGTTAYGLLSGLTFEIGEVTRSGWSSEYLMPNATTNRVPWVIVYEPMVIMNCKDQVTKLAFTATEFALAQLYGWYDWNHSGGRGQSVANLTHKNLPTSVQLEEPWFGYPVYDVTDSVKWNEYDIVRGGGWGMRWMPVSIKEDPPEEPEIPEIPVLPQEPEEEEEEKIYEFSVSNLSVTPSTVYEDESVTVTFRTDSWDLYNAYYRNAEQFLKSLPNIDIASGFETTISDDEDQGFRLDL